jgi:hypothetical protein
MTVFSVWSIFSLRSLTKANLIKHTLCRFVLCEQCDNPETVIKVLAKKGVIVASCKACGHSYNMDITHKLATFIIKVTITTLGAIQKYGIGKSSALSMDIL